MPDLKEWYVVTDPYNEDKPDTSNSGWLFWLLFITLIILMS